MPKQKQGKVVKPEKEPIEKVDKEEIVAEFLGVHPKYFLYEGPTIRINIWQFEHDGFRFNGWTCNPEKEG